MIEILSKFSHITNASRFQIINILTIKPYIIFIKLYYIIRPTTRRYIRSQYHISWVLTLVSEGLWCKILKMGLLTYLPCFSVRIFCKSRSHENGKGCEKRASILFLPAKSSHAFQVTFQFSPPWITSGFNNIKIHKLFVKFCKS